MIFFQNLFYINMVFFEIGSQKYFFWTFSKLKEFSILADKCKSCELYRRMCYVYGKVLLIPKSLQMFET